MKKIPDIRAGLLAMALMMSSSGFFANEARGQGRSPAGGRADSCATFTIETDTLVVLADVVREHVDTFEITAPAEGYYRISARVGYNSGNEQINESFYLLVRNAGGELQYPVFGNIEDGARRYQIVQDDSVDGNHWAVRSAGLFYFSAGQNTIELHHYADIAQDFDQFVNCGPTSIPRNCERSGDTVKILGPQSIRISIFFLTLACLDLDLTLRADTDSAITVNGSPAGAVVAGNRFSYTLTYSNFGPSTAREVVLRDTIPGVLQVQDFSPRAPDARESNVLTWRYDSLAVGFSGSITFTALAPENVATQPFPLYSGSEIFAPNDTLPDNNRASTLVYVVLPPPPPENFDLAITKQASVDTTRPDSTHTYTLAIRNNGPAAAEKFTVQDTVPAFVAISGAVPPATQANGRVLSWELGPLPADSSLMLSYAATVATNIPDLPAQLANVATVSAELDTFPDNDQATTRVVVQAPPPPPPMHLDLDLQKAASVSAVPPGGTFDYTLSITNHGPATAESFVLADTLPQAVSASNFSIRFSERDGQILRWLLGPLAPGAGMTITYDAAVATSLQPGTRSLINFSGVSSAKDTVSGNNFASASVIVDLAGECFLDQNVFRPGVEDALGINFELQQAGFLTVNIHDLAGSHLITLERRPYDAGIHRLEWNGLTKNGLPAGGGLYVVTLKTETFTCWKKFMVVR